MQTPTALPIQVAPASASRSNSASASQNADAAQFAQALSREIEQRQHSPAPQASRQPAPARQQSAPAPRAQAAQAPAQAKPAEAGPAQAKPADAAPADSKSASADNDGADAAKDDAAAAAAAAADMLALVASFNQPAVTTAPVATNAADTQAGDASQAAALGGDAAQQAMLEIDAGAGKAVLPAGGTSSFKEIAKAIDPNALGGATANGADAVAEVGAAPATAEAKATASAMLARPAPADNKLAALAVPAQAADAAPSNAGAIAGSAPATQPQADAALRTPEAAMLKEAPVTAAVIAPMAGAIASASIAQAVATAPGDRIGARVGTPAWDHQVGQKIIWMVTGKEQSASLTLNPPDLGPMQVVLNVTNDQASVTFTAAQPEVRQALENAMPKLREMMGENGIALGNATVNAGMPDQRQAQQGEQSRGQATHTRFGGNDSADGAQGASATARQVRTDGAGLVDTFA